MKHMAVDELGIERSQDAVDPVAQTRARAPARSPARPLQDRLRQPRIGRGFERGKKRAARGAPFEVQRDRLTVGVRQTPLEEAWRVTE